MTQWTPADGLAKNGKFKQRTGALKMRIVKVTIKKSSLFGTDPVVTEINVKSKTAAIALLKDTFFGQVRRDKYQSTGNIEFFDDSKCIAGVLYSAIIETNPTQGT